MLWWWEPWKYNRQRLVLARIRLLLPSSERGMFALIKRCLSQRKCCFVFAAGLGDSQTWNSLSFSRTDLSKSF